MIFIWTVSAFVLFLFGSTVFRLLANYRAAKNTGLPIVLSPVAHLNPVWILVQPVLAPILAKLPFGLGSFTRYNTLSWFYGDKYRMHEEYGKVFMHVTPGENELHVADPSVNQQIFSRRRDFEKPEWILREFQLYRRGISV